MDPKDQVVALIREFAIRCGRRSVILGCDQEQTILGIKSPYHPTYIQELKNQIPSNARSWSPIDKMWFAYPSYFNIIKELCVKYFVEDDIYYLNTVGLKELIPMVIKQQYTSEELTKNLISTTIKQLNDMDDKELVRVIIQAYNNKQVTGEEAIEMVSNLYS
jgi:hypothetical protein